MTLIVADGRRFDRLIERACSACFDNMVNPGAVGEFEHCTAPIRLLPVMDNVSSSQLSQRLQLRFAAARGDDSRTRG